MKIGNSNLLPVMGVLTVVAGAVGLQLGESAIAQIDPIHFQGAAPVPRDVSRDPLPQLGPTYAQAYNWEQSELALASECGDCDARNARTAVASTWEPVYEPVYAEAAAPPRRLVAASLPRDVPDQVRFEEDAAEVRQVSRYVHYPVTQEQAERVVHEEVPVEEEIEPTGL